MPQIEASQIPTVDQGVEWADLAVIDLSLADTPAGIQELAKLAVEAMTREGFFYVVNHGYTSEQTKRIFDIANATFDLADPEEKKKHTGDDATTGIYEGYKPKQQWQIEAGVFDQIEQYNVNRKIFYRDHPVVLQPHLGELEAFARHNHFNVLYPILRMLAIGLELPEEALIEQHKFEGTDGSCVRFMKYYPRSEEEEVKTKNVWLKGHTDIGSITILWSQPITGLQILSPDGKWRYIRHIDNALVINAGDVIHFLSGGYYKPTIHRVVQPLPAQAALARTGVFYFSMANDDVPLLPHAESPVLQRIGVKSPAVGSGADVLTMKEWRLNRTSQYGRKIGVRKVDAGLGVEVEEEEVVKGVKVLQYN